MHRQGAALCAAAHRPISWRLQWAHARDWAWELAGCCGPARAHRQGQRIRIMGPCERFVRQLYGPCDDLVCHIIVLTMGQCEGLGMRGGGLPVGQLECIGKGQLRPCGSPSTNIMALTMGPCEGLGTGACRLLWAGSSSSAGTAYSHYGPMRTLCSATVRPMRWSRVPYYSTYNGPMRRLGHERWWATCGPARVHRQGALGQLRPCGSPSTNIMALTMGPCEELGTGACRLLWASSSSSAGAAYSHYGPMRTFHSATVRPMRWSRVPYYRTYNGPMRMLGHEK